MKFLYLLLLFLFIFSCRKNLSKSDNFRYYFCYSHNWNAKEDDSTLNYILFTDIHKTQEDQLAIKKKAIEWGNLVNTICKNKNGCTSDLMYYNSIQEAETNMNELFENYKNSEKYKIEKIAFN